MDNKKLKKNFIRIGLRSDKKLKSSFYNFLYDKHFDWAIILAAFMAPLPYISSKYYVFLLFKTLIFSAVVYFCIRYVLAWKELQEYYKAYKNAIDKSNSLIDKDKLKEKELEGFNQFNKDFLKELELLGKSYKEDKEKLGFKEFIEKNPDKAKRIENLLNKDTQLTKTVFGVSIGVLTVISHLRGIPRNELKNYRRLLIIIVLLILFFAAYTIEMSFL